MPLLLAHEMPGVVANEARHAVDFGAFFSSEDGTTPQELLRAGIYNQIAIALKGGPWRRASLVVIARALAQPSQAAKSVDEAVAKLSLFREASSMGRRAWTGRRGVIHNSFRLRSKIVTATPIADPSTIQVELKSSA